MTTLGARVWRLTERPRRVGAHWLALGVASLSLVMPASRAADLAASASVPQKLIALSFDDAPRGAGAFFDPQDRSGRLIRVLQGAQVPQVAFYVNPGRIGSGPGHVAQLDAYVAAGHVIADHSWSHPKLATVSAAAYLADIDRAETWLKARAGYRPWFRFPYLDEGGPDKAKRDAVRAGLAARGLRHGYATIDGSDWNMEALALAAKQAGKPIDMSALRGLYVETHVDSAAFSDALMRRTLGRSPAQVMLLHETDLAALFVGDLVKALRADGWTIVGNDRAMADPIYAELPDTPYANGTLSEMLAWEKGITGPRWYERNDTKLAGRLFRQRVLHEAVR